MKLGILLSSSDPETAWNAFRFANTAREGGHDVRVFLMGKGVEALTIRDPTFDVGKQIRVLAGRGGEVLACGTCLDTCPAGSIEEGEKYKVNDTCTDCLACVDSCPTGSIVQI